MLFMDIYEIDLSLNNTKVEINPVNYSFVFKDSIHNFFSELNIQLNDISGILQEYLMTAEGNEFQIKYGRKGDSLLNGSYVVIEDQLPSTYMPDSIGGKVMLRCFHDYYNYQEKISKAYTGRISNIISTIISNYNFSGSTINDTGSSTIWYRPLLNQQEFIEDILLPNCYSNNSKESPFFAFIDSRNNFNLRNYYSMINTSIIETLKLANITPNSLQSNNQNVTIANNIIDPDIKRLKIGSTITKKFRKRNVYYRNRQTGEIENTTDYLYSYPQLSDNLPVMNDQNLTTGIYDLIYKETNKGRLEAFKGRKINSSKDSLFLERFLITIPLNTNLVSGNLIEIKLPLKIQDKNTNDSLLYSGKYLIENSQHVWDGENKRAFSQFIISRKFMTIPNNYLTKNKFMKGN